MGRIELEVAFAVGVEDEVDCAILVEDVNFRAGDDGASRVGNGAVDRGGGGRGGGGGIGGERERRGSEQKREKGETHEVSSKAKADQGLRETVTKYDAVTTKSFV